MFFQLTLLNLFPPQIPSELGLNMLDCSGRLSLGFLRRFVWISARECPNMPRFGCYLWLSTGAYCDLSKYMVSCSERVICLLLPR
jgi:hypothetical protein